MGNDMIDNAVEFLMGATQPQELGIALLVIVVLATLTGMIAVSVSWMVGLHKHPSWTFDAAFKHVFVRSIVWTAGVLAIIGAIWWLPSFFIPTALERDARSWQVMATLGTAILSNLFYYATIVGSIRRPKPQS